VLNIIAIMSNGFWISKKHRWKFRKTIRNYDLPDEKKRTAVRAAVPLCGAINGVLGEIP
jgi:hypothetical protein